MSKCWSLLKIQLLGFFNFNRFLHTNDKKEKRRLFIMGAMMLLVLIIMIAYSSALAIGCAYLGMASVLPPLLLLICAVITFVITFMKSNGVLFGFRDYDLVMSLPVKNSAVIISRFLSVYMVNLLISCIGMLPSIIVYGITLNAPFGVWFMMVASIFLAPLLPMMISMLVGAVITAVSVRFRYKNLFIAVLSIAATLTLMGILYSRQWDNASITAIGVSLAKTIDNIYPPAVLFSNALQNADWGSFGQFALISAGAAAFFVLLLSAFYDKINSALFAVHKKSNYHLGILKVSTPFKALYAKEMRRLFSCPVYLLNSSFGAVLLITVGVIFLFTNPSQLEAMLGFQNVMVMGKQLALWLVVFLIGISSTSASSISLEGKSRWLMCSAPVPVKTILDAKIAVNLTILVPAVLISSSMLSISLGMDILETVAMFIIPLLFSVFIAVIGLAFNLKFPKYDWTSEVTAVKQSIAVLATLGTGIAMAFFACGLTALLKKTIEFSAFLAIIPIFVVTFWVYKNMLTKNIYVD